MPIKNTIKTKKIEFSGDNFVEVRGLNLPDIAQLVDAHKNKAVAIYDKFVGRDPNSFNFEDAGVLAGDLIVAFPAVCTHVIALGADAPDQFDEIKMLPPDVQVAALEGIFELTFQMQGGLGNFVETVLRLVKGANGLNAKLKSPRPSMNGSMASLDS